MVFPGSWTFSWFLRWSLRRNALWQTSQRKVFVWLWIRMCLFSLNFDVNFLSQSGKSFDKDLFFGEISSTHLESCTQMEFRRCESIHAACDGNVRLNHPHFLTSSSWSSKLFVSKWNEDSIKIDYCATLLHFAAVCKKHHVTWHFYTRHIIWHNLTTSVFPKIFKVQACEVFWSKGVVLVWMQSVNLYKLCKVAAIYAPASKMWKLY